MTNINNEAADDVLAHSNDANEWADEAVAIERRPSGTQVLSARLPEELARRVIAEAARRNLSMSQLVRDALEQYLTGPSHVMGPPSVESGVGGLRARSTYETQPGSWLSEEVRFAPLYVAIGSDH